MPAGKKKKRGRLRDFNFARADNNEDYHQDGIFMASPNGLSYEESMGLRLQQDQTQQRWRSRPMEAV